MILSKYQQELQFACTYICVCVCLCVPTRSGKPRCGLRGNSWCFDQPGFGLSLWTQITLPCFYFNFNTAPVCAVLALIKQRCVCQARCSSNPLIFYINPSERCWGIERARKAVPFFEPPLEFVFFSASIPSFFFFLPKFIDIYSHSSHTWKY